MVDLNTKDLYVPANIFKEKKTGSSDVAETTGIPNNALNIGEWIETQIATGNITIPGGTGDSRYTHNQAIASDTWTVVHGLNKYPSVSIVDSAGTKFIGEVNYISLNELVITLSSSFSGLAFIN